MSDEPIERLVLADDRAISAVVAWSAIPKNAEPARILTEWSPGVHYDAGLWMRVAGLQPEDHGEVSAQCKHLGFIAEDGTPWKPIMDIAREAGSKRVRPAPDDQAER